MLEKLVLTCQTIGIGFLATGFHVPAASLVPHRICSLCTLGTLCMRQKVAIFTVSGALLAIGKTVALAYEGKPIKAKGEKDLVPRLTQTMEGWRKGGPTTKKKLPVGIDVPIVLADLGMAKDTTEVVNAVDD